MSGVLLISSYVTNLTQDDVVTVIRRVDDNWAEGKISDRIGIFPISFVEMNDAAQRVLSSLSGAKPAVSVASNVDLLQTAFSRCLTLLTSSSCSTTASHSLPSSPSAMTKTAPSVPWDVKQTQHRKSLELDSLTAQVKSSSSVSTTKQPLAQHLSV
jgi:E3 ubiquitin-protein ligase SH3RF